MRDYPLQSCHPLAKFVQKLTLKLDRINLQKLKELTHDQRILSDEALGSICWEALFFLITDELDLVVAFDGGGCGCSGCS